MDLLGALILWSMLNVEHLKVSLTAKTSKAFLAILCVILWMSFSQCYIYLHDKISLVKHVGWSTWPLWLWSQFPLHKLGELAHVPKHIVSHRSAWSCTFKNCHMYLNIYHPWIDRLNHIRARYVLKFNMRLSNSFHLFVQQILRSSLVPTFNPNEVCEGATSLLH